MCHHNRRACRPRRARRERRQGALGMLAAYIIARYEEKRALQESSSASKDHHEHHPETVLLARGEQAPEVYRAEWVDEKGVVGEQFAVDNNHNLPEAEGLMGAAPPTYGQAMRER